VSAAAPTSPQDLSIGEQAHAVLRIGVGVSAAFVIAEAFGWYPTFLPAILAGTLLASLPGALPPKAGFALVSIQSGAAFAAFALASLLRDTPIVLFGAIALVIFVSFATIARGRGFLPLLLVLISFSTIPIVTMVSPDQAGSLPKAFSRSMAVAVVIIWIVYHLWPKVACKTPTPAAATLAAPVAMASVGTAIVLPLMLVYLMYGITDALPVLITTIVLVVNFDPRRGAAQGVAMMVGNFVGGMVALLCYVLLQVAPSLGALALITLVMAMLFARYMQRGGPGAAVGLITFNQTLIMFSLALVPGPSSPGLWASRLLQFAIACTFAVGMMILLFPSRADR
jgi:hypothetical protein